jgi:hypothetical protein
MNLGEGFFMDFGEGFPWIWGRIWGRIFYEFGEGFPDDLR